MQSSCCTPHNKTDYFFYSVLFATATLYCLHFVGVNNTYLSSLAAAAYDFINTIYWGIILGFLAISLLSTIPRELIISSLGSKPGFSGIFRAAVAGILLDLCSHGILMVAAKLYERGASTPQTVAFLVASPWNSLSLTIILISLIGLPYTLLFIILSFVIAILTGLVFEALQRKSIIPPNPNRLDIPPDFQFLPEFKSFIKQAKISPKSIKHTLIAGFKESKMVLKWILLGVLIAACLRTFLSADHFQHLFAPTTSGLLLTLLFATILEVCSEGSSPIAADILTRAHAPGNAFAFLMSGVSTDYTEFLILRDLTRSIRIPLLLIVITLPQILLLSIIINIY